MVGRAATFIDQSGTRARGRHERARGRDAGGPVSRSVAYQWVVSHNENRRSAIDVLRCAFDFTPWKTPLREPSSRFTRAAMVRRAIPKRGSGASTSSQIHDPFERLRRQNWHALLGGPKRARVATQDPANWLPSRQREGVHDRSDDVIGPAMRRWMTSIETGGLTLGGEKGAAGGGGWKGS